MPSEIATSIPPEKIFRELSFDLLVKGAAFNADTCSFRFTLQAATGDLLTHFRRQVHPYIYDMLHQLSDRGMFPFAATIIYDKDRGVYYFRTEI